MQNKIYQKILKIIQAKKTAFTVLLDPDRNVPGQSGEIAAYAEEEGADLIFVGSSVLLNNNFQLAMREIKQATSLPVIIFPGNTQMISPDADAILFLSLISSRNPEMLIGQQVKAAPLVRELKLEPIPTGYILVESGKLNAAQFMSGSLPIPRDKPDLVCAHALAAEYMGMKMIFADAGSGADQPIPDEMISEVKNYISIPLCIGGGIKTPEKAFEKAKAGADIVVIGNAFEQGGSESIAEFADAIHSLSKSQIIK